MGRGEETEEGEGWGWWEGGVFLDRFLEFL